MNEEKIVAASEELYDALVNKKTITPLRERYPDISIDNAYKVSLRVLAKRLAAGERVIGKKIGVTSKAVQDMLSVYQPDFGFLTDKMIFTDTVPISKELVQARAEGEIAFLLKAPLVGPGVTEEDVLAATESVMPCFEIVDSRIADWKITIEDTVADNASCGLFAINDKAAKDPNTVDLINCEMVVKKNGQVLSRGLGSAALGNPLTCVAWLANVLGEYDVSLNAGDIILSGALVPLEPVEAGDSMSLSISGIGDLTVEFV